MLRSALFFSIYAPYVVLLADPSLRFFVWPVAMLNPSRRSHLAGAWLRWQMRFVLFLARVVAGVHVRVDGEIPAEAVVAVMNHQSLFDIPIAVTVLPDPPVMFATRDRYRTRIPAVSLILRLGRFPFVSQRPSELKKDLATLREAAARVGRGENSLLVFAEGHRTRDGDIGRFMRAGPRHILIHSRRPVYTIVADGMYGARTFTDALASIANSHVHVVINGPFDPPSAENADAFLEHLHDTMVATLARMRSERAT